MSTSSKAALEKVKQAQDNKETAPLLEMVRRQADEVDKALPSGIDRDRFIRLALTMINKPNSGLHRVDPYSVLAGMMDAAALGLELSDVTGQAYLIPRSGVARFQIGYKGLIELAARAGILVSADVVHQGDQLTYQKGTHAEIVHIPNIDVDDGPIRAFYAIARPEGRRPEFDIRSLAWMERFRDKHASTTKPGSPWVEHFEAMGRKTMIRRVLNDMPTSAELRTAFGKDAEGFAAAPDPSGRPATGAEAEDLLAGLEAGDSDEENDGEQEEADDE